MAAAGRLLQTDWEWQMTLYAFPKTQRKHLQASNNLVESLAAVRLREAAGKRFKTWRTRRR